MKAVVVLFAAAAVWLGTSMPAQAAGYGGHSRAPGFVQVGGTCWSPRGYTGYRHGFHRAPRGWWSPYWSSPRRHYRHYSHGPKHHRPRHDHRHGHRKHDRHEHRRYH